MISSAVIDEISRKEGMNRPNVEKDYFLTLLLDAVADTSLFKDNFVFKGGTALRKAYFQNYRYSEDLDFTLKRSLSEKELQDSFDIALEYIKKEYNAESRIWEFRSRDYFSDVKIQFIGLEKKKIIITFDLSPKEIIIDPPENKIILNPYYEKSFSIETYSLDEILAEKLRSILQRTRVRDYYDAWYLLTLGKKGINDKKVRSIFMKKVEYKGLEYEGIEQFLRPEKIEAAKAYYSGQVGSHMKNPPQFDKIIQELKEALQELELN